MALARGWSRADFGCLDVLWGSRESGWTTTAGHPRRAYGIPQAKPGRKMASAGADWLTSAATQIGWGLGYIERRYRGPCAALAHSRATGWY